MTNPNRLTVDPESEGRDGSVTLPAGLSARVACTFDSSGTCVRRVRDSEIPPTAKASARRVRKAAEQIVGAAEGGVLLSPAGADIRVRCPRTSRCGQCPLDAGLK